MARRRSRSEANIWPGFVDGLSTLLLVLMFVLSIFVVAQFYLGDKLASVKDELASKDDELARQMGAAGRKMAVEQFDDRLVFDQIHAEYEQLFQLRIKNYELRNSASATFS